VLIHGAAGGVGSLAVPLARWRGARVTATASARHGAFLRQLGVDELIDYETTRFEDVVHDQDLVLDLVGGETQERSWRVLRRGGVLVSLASPPRQEQAHAAGGRGVFFIVEPNRSQLIELGRLFDSGVLQSVVNEVFPLEKARDAFERAGRGHLRGKIVLRVDAPAGAVG
jgi:NADPH:quinone reductase-like Zn-dependent oxidoreductase